MTNRLDAPRTAHRRIASRLTAIGCALCVLLAAAPLALHAQDATPAAPDEALSAAGAELGNAAARAEAAASRAEQALAQVEQLADNAGTFLEAAGGQIGWVSALLGVLGVVAAVVPILAAAASLLLLNRLNRAVAEARAAKDEAEGAADTMQRAIGEARAALAEQQAAFQALIVDVNARLQKQSDEQRDYFERALSLATDQIDLRSQNATRALALLQLGESQYRPGDFKGAIESYIAALALDPNNPLLYYRIGYIYVQTGRLEEAEYELRRALAISPDFPPAKAALGYTIRRMGERLEPGAARNEKMAQAEQLLLSALQASARLVDEDGESWWGSLGGLYKRQGRIDDAIDAYMRAAEDTPRSSYPFNNLALLYIEKGDVAGMRRMFRRVEKLADAKVRAEVENYWAYADLVAARAAIGNAPGAQAALEVMLEITPQDSDNPLDLLDATLARVQQALLSEDDTRDQAAGIAPLRETIARAMAQRAAQREQAARTNDATESATRPDAAEVDALA